MPSLELTSKTCIFPLELLPKGLIPQTADLTFLGVRNELQARRYMVWTLSERICLCQILNILKNCARDCRIHSYFVCGRLKIRIRRDQRYSLMGDCYVDEKCLRNLSLKSDSSLLKVKLSSVYIFRYIRCSSKLYIKLFNSQTFIYPFDSTFLFYQLVQCFSSIFTSYSPFLGRNLHIFWSISDKSSVSNSITTLFQLQLPISLSSASISFLQRDLHCSNVLIYG